MKTETGEIVVIDGNEAVARALLSAGIQVVPGYTITPSTKAFEELVQRILDNKLNVKPILMEGEHSAFAAAVGAAYTGARTVFISSAHGIEYAHEIFWTAALMRLPIVIIIVNRAMGVPWNINPDQQDSLGVRDIDCIQLYCENVQEIYDTTLMAYKIAEELSFPVIVVYEGFELSHRKSLIDVPKQKFVDEFLPLRQESRIDFDNPRTYGGLVSPEFYFEMQRENYNTMQKAERVVERAQDEFNEIFHRKYEVVEKFNWEEPDIALVTSGAPTSTARCVVENSDIALMRIRMFRPFSEKKIKDILSKVKKVGVVDRNISVYQGIFYQEIKSALYDSETRPMIQGYIAGLGGRNMGTDIFELVIRDIRAREKSTGSIFLPKDIQEF
jgi:pyruvate/2-oxoacid:ferredoxin oxidoreductase alpha subunit